MFPWLVFDEVNKLFTCSTCIKEKKKNVFTRGKSALKPKKDDFLKHESQQDHKLAAAASVNRRQFVKAVTTATDRAKEAMIAEFKTVLCLAQEDIPNSKVHPMVGLQIENVSDH